MLDSGTTSTAPASADALRLDVERFIFQEAQLLDAQRFDDWLTLLSDDITYLVPNFTEEGLIHRSGVVMREDRNGLRARVARISHPQNPTRRPPARTLHAITNVVVEDSHDGVVRVSSNLVYFVSKDRRLVQYPARVVHELVRVDGDWRIRAKTITLLINDLPLGLLSLI